MDNGMTNNVVTLKKEYSSKRSAFLLDKAKLSRLVNVIEDKYNSGPFRIISKFIIVMKNGKEMLVSDVEDILRHDNTVKNPISTFTLHFEDQDDNTNNNCEIVFNKGKSIVRFNIKSINPKFANELYAEIDEQLERTIVFSFNATLSDAFGIIVIILFFGSMLLIIFSGNKKYDQRSDYLSETQIRELLNNSKVAQTTNNRLDIIYKYHIMKLENLDQSKSTPFISINIYSYQILLMMLPVFIIMISMLYLFAKCYPGSIFLWGDFEEFYSNIITKRKFIINTIIFTLLIGIIGNLFVYGLSDFLGKSGKEWFK
jgi:hypothetical protein